MDNEIKNNKTENADQKARISFFTIIEICILALGVAMSISSTLKPLHYTVKYAWCIVFPILGTAMIIYLIVKIRKKRIWLTGAGFIILYLFVAGYGAYICELNSARFKRLSYFAGKEVKAILGDTEYIWDGESVSYNSDKLEYIEPIEKQNLTITVNGDFKQYGALKSSEDNCIYLEIYGGGTGIFLKLSPQ